MAQLAGGAVGTMEDATFEMIAPPTPVETVR